MKRRLSSSLVVLLLVAGCQDPLVGPEPIGDPAEGPAVTALTDGVPPAALRIDGATHGGRPLSATLTGDAEVPGPGDPDGSGSAAVTVNVGQRVVCYELTVDGIEPATAAHIHVGTADVAGPVVVGLTPPTDGTSSGCATGVDRALLRTILQSPGEYYVNVHNAAFPAGALRGQLER